MSFLVATMASGTSDALLGLVPVICEYMKWKDSKTSIGVAPFLCLVSAIGSKAKTIPSVYV